jgi:hypothetical protein
MIWSSPRAIVSASYSGIGTTLVAQAPDFGRANACCEL